MKCELVDPDGLLKQLRILKSVNVDGVAVDCWWGIVEAHAPQEYNWNGYKRLFQMVRELKLKLQVNLFSSLCPLCSWYTWLYLYNSIEIESFMHSFSVVSVNQKESVNHTDENLQLGVSMFGAGNLFWLTLYIMYISTLLST